LGEKTAQCKPWAVKGEPTSIEIGCYTANMVCCCDPFEPLSPEEMEESAEMIKSMQAEKSTQAAKTTSPVAATADQADAVDAATVEMEELLVSGKLLMCINHVKNRLTE
jgi:hypothetical protein